jgi:putative endonuclease
MRIVNAVYVYILANGIGGTLYIGAATNLIARAHQHRSGDVKGFTRKYKVDRLVYYEVFDDLEGAFLRERQLKKWNRSWKIELIERSNPNWSDLYPEIATQ